MAKYATDERGIRRFVAEGDEIPEGWTAEGEAPPPTVADDADVAQESDDELADQPQPTRRPARKAK